jgi:hypothetical protein
MKRIAREKIYFDRSRAYMSYVQLGMIGVVFVNSVEFLSSWADAYPLLTYGSFGLLTMVVARQVVGHPPRDTEARIFG